MKKIYLITLLCLIAGIGWGQTLVAGWDFQTTTNGGTAAAASPNAPLLYTSNFGSGTIYLDGTNGSSTWVKISTGNEVSSFAGTAVNAGTGFSTTTTGAASLALLCGSTTTSNGKSIVFKFSMSSLKDLVVTYATQKSGATTFGTQTWEYSTDGSSWNAASAITSVPNSFAAQTLTTITGLDNATAAYLKLTLTGATATGGNNRLDNIQLKASPLVASPAITLNTTVFNGAFGSVNVGNSSASSSFTVSGNNLTENIIVAPPAGGFEIRTGANAFSTSNITLTQAAGVVAATTIDTRFTPSGAGAQSGNIDITSTGATAKTAAVSGTGVLVVNPTKLVITTINPASPIVSNLFSVTVQAQDGSNNLQNVVANTDVILSVTTGNGNLGGTVTGTIAAGSNQVVISGITYPIAEPGVVLTATRVAGDALTAGNSTAFNVLGVATQMAFVGLPTTGTVGANVTSFTVEARRDDNSVDVNYIGDIALTVATGIGNISGTNPKPAVAGVATFNNIKFDAAGEFTLTSTSTGLTNGTSGTITITAAPIAPAVGELLISQINSQYSAANDEFIEIVNTTNKQFDLSTIDIRYQSAGGTTTSSLAAPSGLLQPYSYYLISRNANITVGSTTSLAVDFVYSSISMAQAAGQVGIVLKATPTTIIDAFGWGTITGSATYTEGTAAAAPATSAGFKRANEGVDNNTNNTDFTAVAATAIDLRNSTSRISPAGAAQLAGSYNRLFVTGNSSIVGNVTVTGNLNLVGGILTTTGNTLELAATATVVGGSSTSFIDGPLTRNTAATSAVVFPVGKGSAYRPVSVYPSAATAGVYTAEYFNTTSPAGTNAADITGVAQNEYWDVNRTSGSDAQIEFTYDATNTWSSGAPTSGDNITVAHLVAGVWKSENGDVLAGTSAGGTLKTKVLSSFSPFTFGFGATGLLPLTITSLNAVKANTGNLISWSTTNEINVRSINVERSADSRNFTELAKLNAGSNNYQYTDATPINGINYYRLKLVDRDGKFSYSKVVAVINKGNGAIVTGIYPTLTTGNVTLDVAAEGTQKLQLVFIDAQGRTAAIKNITATTGNNTISLDASALANGVYHVKVLQANNETATFKIVKQ